MQTCSYNRTFLTTLGGLAESQTEIMPDTSYGQGNYDSTPLGSSTMNFMRQTLYSYHPGRGNMPDWLCTKLGRGIPCGFRPGDVNPWGLRRIDMRTGRHLKPPRPVETSGMYLSFVAPFPDPIFSSTCSLSPRPRLPLFQLVLACTPVASSMPPFTWSTTSSPALC